MSKYINSNNYSALEIAAKFGTVTAIGLLVGIPLPLPPEPIFTINQHKLLNFINEDGRSLLAVAAENCKKDNVNFFITCGVDVNCQSIAGKHAVDLAWVNKHYDVVLQLLEADSELPDGFDLLNLCEDFHSQKELKEFIEDRDKLHLAIQGGNMREVESYILKSKPSMYYLNSRGISAAFTAIQSKQFQIYAFMKLFGVNFKDEVE